MFGYGITLYPSSSTWDQSPSALWLIPKYTCSVKCVDSWACVMTAAVVMQLVWSHHSSEGSSSPWDMQGQSGKFPRQSCNPSGPEGWPQPKPQSCYIHWLYTLRPRVREDAKQVETTSHRDAETGPWAHLPPHNSQRAPTLAHWIPETSSLPLAAILAVRAVTLSCITRLLPQLVSGGDCTMAKQEDILVSVCWCRWQEVGGWSGERGKNGAGTKAAMEWIKGGKW